jgi:alginate O-acetyltransferase complex protein AlgI
MSILQIGVLAALALVAGRLPKGRQLSMLAISVFAIFWLQPSEPFISLGFWFPLATLGIAVLGWALTSTPAARGLRQNWPAGAILVGVPFLLDLARYLPFPQVLVKSTPPVAMVAAALVALAAAAVLLARWQRASGVWRVVALIVVVATFVLLKSPALMGFVVSLAARAPAPGRSGPVAPLAWLGFSYVAFRLMHTLRDRQSGRLPDLALSEYVNYVIFFPAFTAGPIDRAERFVQELRTPLPLNDADWIDAGTRFFVGLFKKFVVADLLGVISISDQLAPLVKAPGWLWFFLYAYALRIYFDFSGYTDVAIGMGRLLGIRLPENFAAPYLKSNLTQFWNSWHMTLTQWFRSYVFNPLTRRMRASARPAPVWLVVLVGQLTTMLLIGLWHGIAWNFAAWGLWHGFGLFIHNRWTDFTRNRMPAWTESRWGRMATRGLGVFLTFNFVALGWLFFVLSSLSLSWQTMLRLFGST